MNNCFNLSLLAIAALLGGCRQSATDPGLELARLQDQIIEKQTLLWKIHLDLDSAATEMANAQETAQDGNCSAAEFHSTEAYRKLISADEAILELGRDLQVMFNLDARQLSNARVDGRRVGAAVRDHRVRTLSVNGDGRQQLVPDLFETSLVWSAGTGGQERR